MMREFERRDQELAARLADFIPDEVFDIHAHPYHADHFPPGTIKWAGSARILGCAEHRAALQRYMPAKTLHGLYFGMPSRQGDRPAINAWLAGEVSAHGTPLSRGLMLVSPADDPAAIAEALRRRDFVGLKVYHCYAPRPDTMNAAIEEFTPEWMWEIAHETGAVLMLHLVRDGAIADPDNQRAIRRLCRAYPRVRLVLAHIARSFCYRNARDGLQSVADLENVVVDTSAVVEAEAFRAALETLGPRRILFGSDYGVSEFRGRCVTVGSNFFWLHPETVREDLAAGAASAMTLVGIESLLCLREACEDHGLGAGDLEDLFLGNALRLLAGPATADGPPRTPPAHSRPAP